MAAFTKKILAWKTGAFLKNSKIKRESVNYAEAKHFGIIFTVTDLEKHTAIKKLFYQLEKEGKRVTVLSFLGKDKENYEFMFDFFKEGDVSFWGNITAGSVINFVEKKFDYLFHLDIEPNVLIDNILARSKARCRVGCYREEESSFYELMVKPQRNDINLLAEQMHYYTKKLSEE